MPLTPKEEKEAQSSIHPSLLLLLHWRDPLPPSLLWLVWRYTIPPSVKSVQPTLMMGNYRPCPSPSPPLSACCTRGASLTLSAPALNAPPPISHGRRREIQNWEALRNFGLAKLGGFGFPLPLPEITFSHSLLHGPFLPRMQSLPASTKSRISLAPSLSISCRGCKTPPLSENLCKQGIPRRRGKVLIFFVSDSTSTSSSRLRAVAARWVENMPLGEEGDAGKERLDVDDLSSVWKEFLPPSLLAPEPAN